MHLASAKGTRMTTSSQVSTGIKLIIAFHLGSALLWTFGQTWAVIDYDRAAGWGLQDPRSMVDPVVVEVNRAIGLADTLLMLPLHLAAAIGLWRMRLWGAVVSWLVFGMTMYWPLVFWCSQFLYGQGGVKHAPTEPGHMVITGAIFLIACWGSWYLFRVRERLG